MEYLCHSTKKPNPRLVSFSMSAAAQGFVRADNKLFLLSSIMSPTSLAPVAATLSPSDLVEAVTVDDSGVAFSRGRAVSVGAVGTLHGGCTVSGPKRMASN